MKKAFFLFFLFCGFTITVQAQQNLTDAQLELIELSLDKSYELKAANYELSLDSLEYKSIRQNFIPTLEFDALYGYGSTQIITNIPTVQLPITGINLFEGDKKFNTNGNVLNANLTAKALLFSGLQVNYGAKASNQKIRAMHYLLFKERAEIIKDVISTFDKIELLKQSKHVLESGLRRITKEKERVLKAISNGLATPYERDKIRAAELNIAAKKTEINGNLGLLYLKLSMLTGVDVFSLKAYMFELKPWLVEISRESFIDRPEVKALNASIKGYDYKLKMNKHLFLPKIQAFANLSYANLFNAELNTPYNSLIGNEPINLELNKFQFFPTYFLGVGMKWEIFSGLKHTTEIGKTSIEKSMAEDKKADVLEKLKLFAKKTQVDFEVKNEQLLYKEQEKQVALNTLNSAVKQYKAGLISITERLEAETDYQDVTFNYYELITQQRMAALELLISTGSLQVQNLNQ
ncbi:TolC family protein [Tamlana haliotis]|uniref:TolC family protein n=1 Tax=Pseudotamlana haliotis TaxID=2614804 RepID=A0A6N6MFM3_9FLAO|nr:TolC family protein [Tamlana haliotis]KAB1066849.1 TolC family protein [Tamlana haliotis]